MAIFCKLLPQPLQNREPSFTENTAFSSQQSANSQDRLPPGSGGGQSNQKSTPAVAPRPNLAVTLTSVPYSLCAFLQRAAVPLAHWKCPGVRWLGFDPSRIPEKKQNFRVDSAEIKLTEGASYP